MNLVSSMICFVDGASIQGLACLLQPSKVHGTVLGIKAKL
jgi:hypothetical protein